MMNMSALVWFKMVMNTASVLVPIIKHKKTKKMS